VSDDEVMDIWHGGDAKPKPVAPRPVVAPLPPRRTGPAPTLDLKVGQLVRFRFLGRERGGIIRYFKDDGATVVIDAEPVPRTGAVGGYLGRSIPRRDVTEIIRNVAPEIEV